jgi:hypothetical protein
VVKAAPVRGGRSGSLGRSLTFRLTAADTDASDAPPSWPVLDRPSTAFLAGNSEVVDDRNKSGHDEHTPDRSFFVLDQFHADWKRRRRRSVIPDGAQR